MRTPISRLTLLEPRSLRHALQLLARHRDAPLTPIAGCTDVYVGLNFGTLPDRRFLDLWPLDALRGIKAHGRGLWIGALTTYTDVIRAPLIRRRLPMLAAASREVGGIQIQNRGTIGGNIVNASPAGDALPPLAAADAIVVLQSLAGTRRVPLTAFYTGYRQTVRRPDELLVGVEVPHVRGRQWFRKVGTRAAQAISKVVMAAVRDARNGRVRLAFGSVAPTVIRARRTEAALAAGASLADAQKILASELSPIDDLRSTAEYRRRVAVNLLAKFWNETDRR